MLLSKKYDMGTEFRAHVVDMIIKALFFLQLMSSE